MFPVLGVECPSERAKREKGLNEVRHGVAAGATMDSTGIDGEYVTIITRDDSFF